MSRSLNTALLELEEDARAERALDEQLRSNLEEIERELPLESSPAKPSAEAKDKAAYDLIDEIGATLACDAQDFIAVLFWLMTAAGYSEKARSFVLAVFAYADRNSTDEAGVEITDPHLAELMNCCERTIQRGRAAYKKETVEIVKVSEQHSFRRQRLPIISINEGEYIKKRKQNQATRYHFECAHLVTDAVQEARESKLWESDYRTALKEAAYHVYEAEREAQSRQFPVALKRRRKRTLSIDSERQRIINTIRTGVARLNEIQSRMNGDFSEDWEALKSEMETIYRSLNPSQTVAEIKDKPLRRQSVAPTDEVVCVSRDLPSDAPLSDYLKVPSIARQVRSANQSQEGARYG
jgi:hypothetical protein